MQSRVDIVRSWLSYTFSGAPVSHQHVDMLHKFRIETAPMRWLYVSDEFVDYKSEADLLEAFQDTEVFMRLTAKPAPSYFLLTCTRLCEVDAEFGRGASA